MGSTQKTGCFELVKLLLSIFIWYIPKHSCHYDETTARNRKTAAATWALFKVQRFAFDLVTWFRTEVEGNTKRFLNIFRCAALQGIDKIIINQAELTKRNLTFIAAHGCTYEWFTIAHVTSEWSHKINACNRSGRLQSDESRFWPVWCNRLTADTFTVSTFKQGGMEKKMPNQVFLRKMLGTWYGPVGTQFLWF